MYIVDRQTFIEHPEGTLFSEFEPNIFGPLCIKGCSIVFEDGNDFCYQEIADALYYTHSGDLHDKLTEAVDRGTQLKMDFHCEGRDGCFEYNQPYAVWDKQDVQQLIDRLQECVK